MNLKWSTVSALLLWPLCAGSVLAQEGPAALYVANNSAAGQSEPSEARTNRMTLFLRTARRTVPAPSPEVGGGDRDRAWI